MGGVVVLLGFFLVISGIQEEMHQKGYVKKSAVKEAFKDMKWNVHRFYCYGQAMKDTPGRETFYPTKEIDAAMARLNHVLK